MSFIPPSSPEAAVSPTALADQLEKLAAQATSGPWFPGRPVEMDDSDSDGDNKCVSVGGYDLSDRPTKHHHYEDSICEMWGTEGHDPLANANLVSELVTNLPTIITALRRPEKTQRQSGGLIDQHQLETVARIVESWVEWANKDRDSQQIVNTDVAVIMSLPVPYWPTIAQMEVWINLFRSSAQRIRDLENEIDNSNTQS